MPEWSAKEVWETALGELQLQVNEANYDTWLRNTNGIDYHDNHFTVGVPSIFVAEWLGKRQRSLIRKTLIGIIGQKGLKLQFKVVQGETDTLTAQNSPLTTINSESPLPLNHDTYYAPRPHFNPRYTFNSFVVGSSNRMAYAAALGVAESPGNTYNPLFIYGGVGRGKTHLMHAIGHLFSNGNKGARVVYASGEQFTNQFISSIRDRTTDEFRNKFRNVDLLMLDDIQFISGKEQTQEGFFHTFNELHNTNKQIVLTSDRPPKAMALLEERLRSRFEWGLLTDIQPPDLETRTAILQCKAESQGTPIPPDVIDFLAHRIQSNIRELEGSLNRIVACSRLTRVPLSTEMAEEVLSDMTTENARRSPPDAKTIIATVSKYFDLLPSDLEGKKRDKHTVMARQIAMYLLREETRLSMSEIGRLLGGKDHSTVVHGYQKMTSNINAESRLRRDVLTIRETLYSKDHRN
ncbi:MAG: chromosomal replication initiator protein DnaA [Dehalococcoidia bacterium]|nr:chromosomal replication initiator protein DnaA [Dehalococcoidia bacterium]